MAPRKSTKPNPIDPIALTAAALKACKCAVDYNRLGTTTEPAVFQAAWNQLPTTEQNRITDIVNANTQPSAQSIADELMACGTLIQLQAVKSQHGELLIKSAWKLLSLAERDRITALCKNGTQPEPQSEPVAETQAFQVELQPADQPSRKPTLIGLTAELEQIDNLLDTIDSDNIPVDLQTAVNELLAQREATQEAVLEKIDSYCGLIQSRLLWAAARKAEADRLAKLAESDMKTVDFLKGRLKAHLEATDQKKLRTKHFNISICQNGGKAPLRFDDTPPKQLPERFQRVCIEPDKEAIRVALEAGEELSFAYLGERENHLRIK